MSPIKIYRPASAARELGISRTTLWRMVKDGIIQKPIKIGRQAVGWQESTIIDFIKSRQST